MDYNAQDIERKYYEIWEKRGYFEIDSNKHIANGENFCIMMPPPNITGSLHIGHALTYTLQDIITRFKRMEGFRTLWQPGIDHAGIATQNVVEKQLLARGIKKEQIGREAFLSEVWAWKEKSGGEIVSQLKRLGASAAWNRMRFTMDKGLQNAVKKAFVAWYERGLIFQGDYMVNWCTHDGALSDIEVEFEENKGKLYYLRYFLKDSKDFIIVATTRPETYFGDTAVMVNPQDERYRHLLGRKVVLPLIEREVKIIGDESVEMSFGTGAVKVTPAHDNNDYEVGLRHKLDFITIFDKSGILNEHCGEFRGLERLEARDKIISKLELCGFVEKIEDYTNQVGKCYRCGNIVEPYISKQWFVKKSIAKETIKRVNDGECRFYPNQWINNFNAWMGDLRDWCISRQLWWGHRIPVFYCDDCGIQIASQNDSETCKTCSKVMRQDEDVLDTWFSSGLWAFSTLGWGNYSNANSAYSEVNSSLGNHCVDLAFRHKARTQSPLSLCQNTKNSTSKTSNTRILGEMQGDSGDSMESNAESSENNSVIARKSAGLTKQSIKSCEATPHTCKSIEPTAEALPFNANDLSNFYPNSLLITSFDILFFWVARMLFSGESLLQKLPFKDIYLHALVCDEFGKKMSKSKGNVINPLELIESHSSDILRFCLAYNCIQGRDIRISQKSLTIGNALAVKLINALNFLLLYKNQQNASLNPHDSPARTQDSTNDFSHDSTKDSAMQNIREFSSLDAIKSPLGLYMYAKFNLCVKEVKTALDAYRFNDATNALYRFLFNDFCDFGIEAVKAQKEAVFELGGILRETMKLLHPFMPFISEFIWQNLNGTTLEDSSSIMIERFPTFDEKLSVNADFETIRDIITSIRRAKTNIDLANKSIALSFIKAKLSDETLALTFIPKLAKCEKVEFVEAKMEHCIFEMGERCEVYIPANELDLDMLIKKIEAKIAKTSKEKEKLESMLKNPNFIKNAPKNLIDSNQEALSEAQSRLAKLESELKSIKEI